MILVKSGFPNKTLAAWSLENTDSLNFLGAYKWEYCKPLFGVNLCAMNPSSSVNVLKYFSNKLTLQVWIIGLNLAPMPEGVTVIVVFSGVYPIPVSITFTEINLLFSIIGVKTAPIPGPKMLIFGEELYSSPEFWTRTSTIFPSDIIGESCAFFPALNIIFGLLLKLRISASP